MPCWGADDHSNPTGVSGKDELRIDVQWPNDRATIEVPLDFLDAIPVIKCKLNGKASVLYVDTVCQATCLYQDRLNGFGIKITGQKDFPNYTAGGYVGRRSFSGEFELAFEGGLRMKVSGAPCLPGSGRDPNHDVDGILGVTVMKALNAVVDLEAGKIKFAVKKAPNKGGAANGSQPVRSQRNQTSPAAGSRR